MHFFNYLPVDSWHGLIEGIEIRWNPNARAYLQDDATYFKVDVSSLKRATEHLAVDSAKRHNKTKIQILGSFHITTTITATGDKVRDQCHCTVSLNPGQAKVHIYVDLAPSVPLEDMTVLKENVVHKRHKALRPATSIRNYPQNENSTLGMFGDEKGVLSTVISTELDPDTGEGSRGENNATF